MDTIKISTRVKGADTYIVRRITKHGHRITRKGNTQGFEPISPEFSNSRQFKVSGHFVHLEWISKKPGHDNPVLKATIHLSHFRNFNSFLEWGESTFGRCFPLIIDGQITRLDLCVDIGLPYNFVHQNLFQPRGRNDRRIESGKHTLYLGAYPNRSRVYEKMLSSKDLDYGPSPTVQHELVSGVRIEAETHREKKPIQTLRQVEHLRRVNPFSHLRFLGKNRLIVDSSLPMKTKTILWAFEGRCKEIGANQARKEFNRSGNFSKTIEKHYRPLQADILKKAWKHRVKNFLGSRPIKFPEPLTDLSFLQKYQVVAKKSESPNHTHWQLLDHSIGSSNV